MTASRFDRLWCRIFGHTYRPWPSRIDRFGYHVPRSRCLSCLKFRDE